MSPRRRRVTAIGFAALGSLIVAVVAFLVWANVLFLADRQVVLDALDNPDVSISIVDEGVLIEPTAVEGPTTGLVFIPGAKVEPIAYAGVLSEVVSASGIAVIITEPTLNLALFDQRPLEAFTAAAPSVTQWTVGGHSLGGVRACFLADSPEVAALILFGSFCANDLSQNDLAVLSLEGSNDELTTQQQIEDSLGLLPESAERVLIEGANHASFGDYGDQPGDGPLETDRETVRSTIADEVAGLVDSLGDGRG